MPTQSWLKQTPCLAALGTSTTLLALASKLLLSIVTDVSFVPFSQIVVASVLLWSSTLVGKGASGTGPIVSIPALKRWGLASLTYSLMLFSAIMALRRVSVACFVLLSELAFVFDIIWPSICLLRKMARTASSTAATAALAGVDEHEAISSAHLWVRVAGALVFAAGDLSFSSTGYAWLIVSIGLKSATSALSLLDSSYVKDDAIVMVRHRTVLSLPVLATIGLTLAHGAPAFSAPGGNGGPSHIVLAGVLLLASGILLYLTIVRDVCYGSPSGACRYLDICAKIAICLLGEVHFQRSLDIVSSIGAAIILASTYDKYVCSHVLCLGLHRIAWRAGKHVNARIGTAATTSRPAPGKEMIARYRWSRKPWNWLSHHGIRVRATHRAGLAALCMCAWIWSIAVLLLGSRGTFEIAFFSGHTRPDVLKHAGPGGPSATTVILSRSSRRVAMRAVVMTGGTRLESLTRLLYSLALLVSDGDRIDTDVWIDIPEGPGAVSNQVAAERQQLKSDIERLGTTRVYRNGLIRAHIWEQHMGLRGQWLDAWDASIPGGLDENTREIGLLLEDDLELSPYAWRWLKAAYAQYGHDRRIAGFSLQRVQLCAAETCNRDLNGGPDGAGGGFLYPLIGTWGYSPTAKSYAKFRKWYYSLPKGYKPYVEGLLPTQWYKHFEKDGTEKKRMWEMHHLKYTDTNEDKYTVYVKCPQNYTLAVNHREVGLNYHTKEESPHAMLVYWTPDIVRFSKNPLVLSYAAEVVDGERALRRRSFA